LADELMTSHQPAQLRAQRPDRAGSQQVCSLR
jgi:hypothetical protein